ncbi:MAG: FIG146518: Zn-dependent hydrolases, including glyoxylases, partial [uncultured Blastococcus sp.]
RTTWPSAWSPVPCSSVTTCSAGGPPWSPIRRATSSRTWSRCAACTTSVPARSTAATARSSPRTRARSWTTTSPTARSARTSCSGPSPRVRAACRSSSPWSTPRSPGSCGRPRRSRPGPPWPSWRRRGGSRPRRATRSGWH